VSFFRFTLEELHLGQLYRKLGFLITFLGNLELMSILKLYYVRCRTDSAGNKWQYFKKLNMFMLCLEIKKFHGSPVQADCESVVHEVTFLAIALVQYFSSNKMITLFRAK
jgi:hypothetical protein